MENYNHLEEDEEYATLEMMKGEKIGIEIFASLIIAFVSAILVYAAWLLFAETITILLEKLTFIKVYI